MTFRYTYKDSAAVRHEASIEARTKDEAFAVLRKDGIRPMKVWPVYKWYQFSPKTYVIVLLALALAGAVAVAVLNGNAAASEPTSLPRSQILGDRAVIDVNARAGWARCFSNEIDRTLAVFAQPGWEAARPDPPDDATAVGTTVLPQRDDPPEFRQVKLIVAGMRDELREYLSDGGTLASYYDRLFERQLAERAVYERSLQTFRKAESKHMSADDLYALWLSHNAKLREMGIMPLPMPESLAR